MLGPILLHPSPPSALAVAVRHALSMQQRSKHRVLLMIEGITGCIPVHRKPGCCAQRALQDSGIVKSLPGVFL